MSDPDQVSYFSRLDVEECWALLSEAEVGRIAWRGPAGIVIVPVNFQLVGRTIVFHTVEGSGLAALADGAEVSFQVDEIDGESAIGWSVLVQGRSGPAGGEASSVSWLGDGVTVGVSVSPAAIDGRVVSGNKKS
ncbi:pyridoxamine 5'-phosphate oxidase family protein [Tessaracoccus flavus]|uniref:Uncharacterized protein n=1 Tax=Tessaracoccus flavus TaxID=1610493 RepID=A0A1Q2CEP2_9ACTN|nr:pyridoxamine 5'-phosphate oxidase family protein [Tessaracoccus flavus]AQP44589.1 hypothetical protein RPIT_06980 [Tessaracoccus flavus]SDZ09045.1 Pyridoxamine 5'-phosphate oxidase [Tessaracoccus flavus]